MPYLIPSKEIIPFVLFVEQKGYVWDELDNDTVEDLLLQYTLQKQQSQNLSNNETQ